MLFAEVVGASAAVGATSSRSEKIAILAGLIRRLASEEVAMAVGFLSGHPRQGKVGIGWAAVYKVDVSHADEPSLDIADLDRAIDEVEATTGSGSAGERRRILTELLERATEDEADFMRRLLTGELRQGALAGLMVDAVAKASEVSGTIVRRALMLSGDLPRTAEIAMAGGEPGLLEVGFELFRPVLPMLASTAEDVATALEGFELASVEWKLDGIRIQVHRKDDEVRVYTRNLNDITEALPAVVEAVRALPVRSAVFDGEAIGLMDDERPLAFQETVATTGRGMAVGFLFDVLHVDGIGLLDAPLSERLERLHHVAPQLRIPGLITSDATDAARVLEESLEAGHEGVVVKDATSLYAAGRRGKAWRKVKPHRTYDLVVLGAEWGHGRRKGWLSNLHLGARDSETGEFVMVGKCFKGLTDELLEWQTKEILAREISHEGIVVWARPELVVEIALDGVHTSTRYPGGVAMRFARVKRYRPDKSAEEADTIDDVRSLLGGR